MPQRHIVRKVSLSKCILAPYRSGAWRFEAREQSSNEVVDAAVQVEGCMSRQTPAHSTPRRSN
eukprot:2372595-Amphidinium_carterae.2